MKDELGGKTMKQFAALRAKEYSIQKAIIKITK